MLRSIGRQILDARKHLLENSVEFNQLAKSCEYIVLCKNLCEKYSHTWQLRGTGSSNLCLVILENVYKVLDELILDDFTPDNLGKFDILVRDHVSHAPGLVPRKRFEGFKDVGFAFWLSNNFCHRNQNLSRC